jgi:small subunit ribosomal protein S5
VKGGRQFGFTALTVVGDEMDAGLGYGKAREVPWQTGEGDGGGLSRYEDGRAQRWNASVSADWTTWSPHRVHMQPASDGTGIIAGGAMRAVFEVGVHNVLAKTTGTNKPDQWFAPRSTVWQAQSPESSWLRSAARPSLKSRRVSSDEQQDCERRSFASSAARALEEPSGLCLEGLVCVACIRLSK